jgi:predicted transcriptional regulator
LAEMERLALEAAVAEARAQVAAGQWVPHEEVATELRAWRLDLQDRMRAETAERKRRLGG